VTITVFDSETSGIEFLGAPYSFYAVDSVPVNYTVGDVTAYDKHNERITNITYRIVDSNDSCTYSVFISSHRRFGPHQMHEMRTNRD